MPLGFGLRLGLLGHSDRTTGGLNSLDGGFDRSGVGDLLQPAFLDQHGRILARLLHGDEQILGDAPGDRALADEIDQPAVLILDPGLVVRRLWVSPDWLARTDVRWLDPDTDEPDETSATMLANDLASNLGDASLRLQQDVYVAAFADYLRGGPWSSSISLGGLSANLHSVAERLDDADLGELADLIDRRLVLD